MTSQYVDSVLDIGSHRWYYMNFCATWYRNDTDWELVRETFTRTAGAIEQFLEACIAEDQFGDAEVTAVKSILQVSSVIGAEKTIERIRESTLPKSVLDDVADLVAGGTGIVGGTAYEAGLGAASTEAVLKIFNVLLNDNPERDAIDDAAVGLLACDFNNIGGATLTPLLCLLRPTRYPVVNQQTEEVFQRCFDIELDNTPDGYLESAAKFRTVRDEFGFDEHLRQLDYFCYWLREVSGIHGAPLPDGIGSRQIWQINAGSSDEGEVEHLWPVWQELGICSIGWDVGPLDELSDEKISAAAAEEDNGEVEEYLRRFGTEMESGQLVIAKDGNSLFGIGVTKQEGYHYYGESLNEQIPDGDVPHVHGWPVEWVVVPEETVDRDVSNWDLETGLSARKTLTGTTAFEGIRARLAERAPDLIPALVDLEDIVADPPVAPSPEQGGGPPESADDYFILQTGSEDWEDESGQQYHCILGNPGTKQLRNAGTAAVAFMQDSRLYARGQVVDIREEERDGETHLYADIEDYEEVRPVYLDSLRGEFETSISIQHSIIKITESDFDQILDQTTDTRYLWVNAESDGWHQQGGDAFYSTTTSDGGLRRNQDLYREVHPGDEVLIYRISPTSAVIGRGHVAEGLHEEPTGDDGESREGITIAWDEQLPAVEMDEISSSSVFDGSPITDSGNPYVITKLTEQQFETVLRLAGEEDRSHFWVTANPAVWDIQSMEPGEEVFYAATTREGRQRPLARAYESARPGDAVLFYESSPTQQIVARGTVVEGLHREEREGGDEAVEGVTLQYETTVDPVDWGTLQSITELDGTTVIETKARGSLFDIPESAFEAILSMATDHAGSAQQLAERVAALEARLDPPTVSIPLPETLYFEEPADLRRQIQASLNSGKHIIFTGPPGTGKTKLAKHVCETVIDSHGDIVDDYQFTTATAEWTTFDTIGGYVPTRSAEGDELTFQPRIFLDCFRDDGRIQNEWLVIDEINRSDIDKAFGQLFSVLSGDSVQLPYKRQNGIEIRSLDAGDSGEEDILESVVTNPDVFPVTPSWRLLATMNTYDKTSLYELSYAFMRRFNFVHVGVPSLEEDGEVRTSLLDPDRDDNYAASWLEQDAALLDILEQAYAELAVLWHTVNRFRTVGPSIVLDILEYLAVSDLGAGASIGPALTDAIIALIFPQLEGLPPNEQRNLVDALTSDGVRTQEGEVSLDLDEHRLERKAKDFFDLPATTDE